MPEVCVASVQNCHRVQLMKKTCDKDVFQWNTVCYFLSMF